MTNLIIEYVNYNENTKAINKKDYYMVILPTLNCNFKCWYCIQDHIPSLMTEEVISLVKRHIKYVIVYFIA